MAKNNKNIGEKTMKTQKENAIDLAQFEYDRLQLMSKIESLGKKLKAEFKKNKKDKEASIKFRALHEDILQTSFDYSKLSAVVEHHTKKYMEEKEKAEQAKYKANNKK